VSERVQLITQQITIYPRNRRKKTKFSGCDNHKQWGNNRIRLVQKPTFSKRLLNFEGHNT